MYTYAHPIIPNIYMFQDGHVHRARFSTTINPLTGNNVHLRFSISVSHEYIFTNRLPLFAPEGVVNGPRCVLYAEPYSKGRTGSGNQRVSGISV